MGPMEWQINAINRLRLCQHDRPLLDIDPYEGIPPQSGLVNFFWLNETLRLSTRTLRTALLEATERRRYSEVFASLLIWSPPFCKGYLSIASRVVAAITWL